MKAVCLLGSPRSKGNSTSLANAFCDTAKDLGAEVAVYELNKLNFKGCQGCGACKTKLDHCALKDDLTPVLEDIKTADVLVLASPIYFFDLSGQMKCFIDRTYSFCGPDFMTNPNDFRLPKGQKLVCIQTQGDSEKQYADVFTKYAMFFQYAGFSETTLIRAWEVLEAGEVADRKEVWDQVEAEAKRLFG